MQKKQFVSTRNDIIVLSCMGTMSLFWIVDAILDHYEMHIIGDKSDAIIDIFFFLVQLVMLFVVVLSIKKRRLLELELDEAILKNLAERKRSDSIVASIGDPVSIQDRDMRIIYQNETIKGVMGSHLGEFCYTAYHGRQTPCTDCGLSRTLAEGVISRFESSTVTPDGVTRYAEIITAPLRDENGDIVAAIETIRDVTAQKEIEDRLRKQLSAIEAAIDGIAILTPTGDYLYLNHAHATIYGYASAEELIGKSWRLLYTDAERQRIEAEIYEGFNSRGGWRGEAVGLRRDGSTFPQEISLTILDDGGIICICRDTTLQKKAEISLKESELQLKTILNNIPDLAWLKDRQSRFLLVNEALARACGRRAEAMVGLSDLDLWPAELAENYIADDCDVMESGERKVVEEVFADLQLGERLIETIKTPLMNSQGDMVGTTGIARDITDRKTAAELVNRLNDDLQRRAQDLLVANRELEAFSYSLSHDLRNILTTMYLSVQELQEFYAPKLDESGQYFVRNLKASCEKMEEFVEAMLVLSRVSRQEMTLGSADLGQIAGQIILDLRSHEPQRKVDFSLTGPLVADCDSHLLRVALENLLGNAWKYTANSSAARIEFGATDKDGTTLYWIRDNGAGFAMADAGKLFIPFQRLHSDAQFAGSGVGLATVQRIILRHGGRIWGEGEPGAGATFFFTLSASPAGS